MFLSKSILSVDFVIEDQEPAPGWGDRLKVTLQNFQCTLTLACGAFARYPAAEEVASTGPIVV